MANIMSMARLSNKPSRNGFDLSTKRNFTAKAGELLPVYVKEVIPGDKIKIDLSAFARTMPINTAAFARIKQYYDFYFVPYSCLWNRANSVLSQMDYNQMHATGLDPQFNVYSGELPYVSLSQIQQYISNMAAVADSYKNNYFGYDRAQLSCKLLQYLGYGEFSTDGNSLVCYNLDVNIMGLLAYQKIYADYYRNEQWEKPAPYTFNVDYMDGTGDMNVPIPTTPTSGTDSFFVAYNMFDMRYCNWQKDLYHGLLPQAQYGETAVVPVTPASGLQISPDGFRVPTSSGGLSSKLIDGSNVPISTTAWTSFSNVLRVSNDNLSDTQIGQFSILALRQYEYLQKWREIAQSSPQNYKDQTKAIWGVDVSKHLSHKCTYLGGISSSMDINEVVNSNITGEFAAEIAGKGYGVTNGQIEFNSDGQFGLIMCIYHALPIVDYTTTYVQPEYTRVNAEDFANPVFDKVGMQAVSTANLLAFQTVGRPTPEYLQPFQIGYAPRYIDYKTDIDRSVGAFRTSLSHWVVSYDENDILNAFNFEFAGANWAEVPQPEQQDSSQNTQSNYTFMKVDPAILNPIFTTTVDSSVDTDQFLCSTFFDVKAVRNLDVNGLPY